MLKEDTVSKDKDSLSGRSLRYSMGDGVFATLMTGFTQDYFTPFLLFLGGGTRHVGLLSSISNLLSSLVQLKSADVAERLKSRKKVISVFVFLQAMTLIPMLLVYFLSGPRVAVFVAVAALFTSFGAFVNPVWGSLMADLVGSQGRGEYFGWRGKILGFVGIGSTFLAGFILHSAGRSNVLFGFAAIFSAAFIFRLLSWRYLGRMHEPEVRHAEDDYFSIFEFLSRVRESNFARFVVFVSLMKFAVNVASPFFAVLMLKDLKFSYLTYTAITVAATLATNLTVRRWGVHSDRVGNLKVVRFTSRLVAFIPLLWLVNQNPVFLFFTQMFSGFAWAGFNLSSSNFVYDAASPQKRTRCIAYFNVLNGVSLSLGALLGGFLAQRLPSGLFDFKLLNIVLVSAVLRLAVAFLMPFGLKEVRPVVEKMRSHHLLLSVLNVRSVFQRAR